MISFTLLPHLSQGRNSGRKRGNLLMVAMGANSQVPCRGSYIVTFKGTFNCVSFTHNQCEQNNEQLGIAVKI
jgi:hypothetical protein